MTGDDMNAAGRTRPRSYRRPWLLMAEPCLELLDVRPL
jgi:hypothetical protein